MEESSRLERSPGGGSGSNTSSNAHAPDDSSVAKRAPAKTWRELLYPAVVGRDKTDIEESARDCDGKDSLSAKRPLWVPTTTLESPFREFPKPTRSKGPPTATLDMDIKEPATDHYLRNIDLRERDPVWGEPITCTRSEAMSTATLDQNGAHHSNFSEEALLQPDAGTEADFQVDNNPFAFTPGQLNRLLNPKSLRAFHDLGGLSGIDGGLSASLDRAPRRRGRGKRKNDAYLAEAFRDGNADLFDDREILFADRDGSLKESRLANLDTQLKIDKDLGDDLIMSTQCMEDLGLRDQLSYDFRDPSLGSISGHHTPVIGVLRGVTFRLKGKSVTFKRDFWVCDAINAIVDIMIGANFIKAHLEDLFGRCVDACRSLFAPWFSRKKESKDEKKQREDREREQQILKNELEILRLQRENNVIRQGQQQQQQPSPQP